MTPDEFKARRLALGWTQRATASALGLSERCVKYYESGDRPISKPAAILFASLVVAEDG